MLRKDLLVRQFEEMGKVLALLLTYKKNKDWDLFEKEIAEAVKRFSGVEINEIEKMSQEEFEKKILQDNTLKLEQKKILATLLFEKMDYYLSIDEENGYRNLKNKCLSLYQFLANDLTENEFNLDIHYKLKYLKEIDPN